MMSPRRGRLSRSSDFSRKIRRFERVDRQELIGKPTTKAGNMNRSFLAKWISNTLTVLTLTLSLAAAQSPQLRIYQIDVEQADSALLVSPNTNTLMIDTGLGSGSAQRIKALMNKLGLTKIDHLVT